MSNSYLEELAQRLHADGVPAAAVTGTVDDLTAYLAEAGTDPEDEFGPVGAFAEQLTASIASGDKDAPGPSDETWEFHADAFHEVGKLNEFGAQGWEVLSYDAKVGFRCRRSPERPLRWEYRREIVPTMRRKAVTERLAEDGWELAATWMFWFYFKRPAAALVGPAGELDTAPSVPRRHFFWSRALPVYLVAVLVGIGAIGAAVGMITGDGVPSGFLIGLPVGGLIAVVGLAASVYLRRRRLDRSS